MTSPPPPAPYLRAAALMRSLIADGTWQPGFRLPSRAVLARELLGTTGDNIIRRAQELLIVEGRLEGRPGSGTYVRGRQAWRALRAAPLGRLVPSGFEGTWQACSTANESASGSVAARLTVEPGVPCVRTEYTFVDPEQRPVLLSTSWEPMTITGATPIVLPAHGPLAGRSVSERMAHIGVTVTRAEETLRPCQLDHQQAHRLAVGSGTLATLIERVHYDQDDRPVETSDLIVPAAYWDIVCDIPATTSNTGRAHLPVPSPGS
ncbi:GntR family transcriptional regulator [Streptomyces sioyaensis]|uniref:GntR family transcriptional regulator n=1 Tax=Streptomyces sioyaensis TaxID=67364 RepID=UPI0037D573C2